MTPAQIVAILIFAVTFVGILSDKIHRTIVGAVGAVVMVAVGGAMDFYSEEEALEAIDFNTIGLLLGMMILVGLLEQTGFFQYAAIVAGRWSKGSPWLLMVTLGTVTTVLSLFLDNVTTIILIAPITIWIAQTLGISPVPLLITNALLSNTGGVGTLVGDPPNIIIGSAAGFSFNDFLTHALPIAFVAWVVVLITLRFVFREQLAVRPRHIDALMDMHAEEALHDRGSLQRILMVFAAVILIFFLHNALHLSPAFVALAGASAALLWVRPAVDKIFETVEWSVLLFFASLFIAVGGLEASGVLEKVGEAMADLAMENLLLAAIVTLWVGAIASAIVDNIPFTIALVPVIQQLTALGINASPLWWALAFGAGFGGNGTPIGSTANVVTITVSERTDTPITTRMWLRSGLIAMLTTTTIASILFVVFFELFRTP
jgi:Na+/H+ antiporter NhaD/arsenite permease-like protein